MNRLFGLFARAKYRGSFLASIGPRGTRDRPPQLVRGFSKGTQQIPRSRHPPAPIRHELRRRLVRECDGDRGRGGLPDGHPHHAPRV
jgi:hypothetical protein